jgi:hypothetical protein
MPADEKNLQVSCSAAVKMTDKKSPYMKGGRTKKIPLYERGKNKKNPPIVKGGMKGIWLLAVGCLLLAEGCSFFTCY